MAHPFVVHAALAATFVIATNLLAAAPSANMIAPADNLVVQGLPEIPAALAREVRRYTEFRSASLLDWHPTKKQLLISTRFANTMQVHEVKMPGGARSQLTFLDEPITSATYEPNRGDYFIFRRDVGGDEFWQLYRYDTEGGKMTLLTDGGRSQNSIGPWNNKGTQIAYTSTKRNGADRDIYVMDPMTPASSRLLFEAKGGGWGILDWSPDDRQLLIQEYLSVNESRLHLVEVATGQKIEVTPRSPMAVAYAGGAFAADGRSLFVVTDKDSEFLRLASLDLATKQVTPVVTNIDRDVEGIDLTPDRKRIAFSVNEAGVSKLHVWDTEGRTSRALTGLPNGVVGGFSWHDNGRDLACTVASARTGADVYSIDAGTGQVTRWTESELGGLNASNLAETTLVRWPSFDGREITGFYYHPPSQFTGKRPVIINIHGGPESQFRPTFLGRYNYYLNELGIAVIFPNVRGSTGYGKTFVTLDNGLKREDSVKDIGALLDWIATQPELDASRVLVTGASYGGYMSLAVATHYNDRIRCAIDVVGISNFNSFLKNTEAYRQDLRRVEYGDERTPELAAFFERTAPLNNAQKITKPLFVVQGGNDPRVPRSEAEQMTAKVRSNTTPVWYLMAKDEGHGFQKKSNVDFQFYSTVMFMQRYLLSDSR